MSIEEYNDRVDRINLLAYQVGMKYSLLRSLRRRNAPDVVIHHDQERLDRKAGELYDLCQKQHAFKDSHPEYFEDDE